MTRAERRARRRARGDARARVARAPGRSIPSRRNRVRVFSSDRFFSFRFRAGSAPASAAASASASRAASVLTRPFRTAPPTLDALFPQKHKKGQGDDKAKEKDAPAWWRYVDPFFREVRAGDLRAVLPPHRWDDDPDLRLPPVGRKHDKPFEDGLPKPEKAPAVFVPAAPTARRRRRPSSSRRRRRPSPSAFRACPPSSARPSHLGRPFPSGCPPFHPRYPRRRSRARRRSRERNPTRSRRSKKRSPRLRSPRRRAARRRRRPALAARPRRASRRSSPARASRSRRTPRRARTATAAAATRARARWTPSSVAARAATARARPRGRRLPKTSRRVFKDAPRRKATSLRACGGGSATTPPRAAASGARRARRGGDPAAPAHPLSCARAPARRHPFPPPRCAP